MTEPEDGGERQEPSNPAARSLGSMLDKALAVQRPAVVAHVARVRRRMPDVPDEFVIRELERQYLITVGALGAAAGGVAAVPILGSSASFALSVAEIGAFVDSTVLFTLAVAEIHGVAVDDLDRRRALVLAVLLGDTGTAIVEKAAGRAGGSWGAIVAESMPKDKLGAVNRLLGRKLLTRFGTRQGALVLGRALPFGIGAAIGGSGNTALGYAAVKAARRAFGTGGADSPPRRSDRTDPKRPPRS